MQYMHLTNDLLSSIQFVFNMIERQNISLNPKFKIIKDSHFDKIKINELIKRAFANVPYSDRTEHILVANLRKSPSFIEELSLIALHGEGLIGHIMFTKANVGTEDVLCLAPLSVEPKFQNQGVGTALIQTGHKRGSELGYGYSVVLGDPAYYGRVGYRPASEYGIKAPSKVPVQYLQAIKLRQDAPTLCGMLVYPVEFGIK